ncbi:MAG: endonuclease/exonuclease/phosphatase family metal-dependent hydrolase [Paraglaciecola sp.]|jgi:endonuclease/exonuclease/phosphatase family metal-dependent hydrolase
MTKLQFIIAILLMTTLFSASGKTLRFATFNVSMEAGNYTPGKEVPSGQELFQHLATGEHSQIRNIAEIIQRTRPDVILLNEFDYTADDAIGVKAFIHNYLAVSQQGAMPIDYPYYYTGPVNTGVPSGVDLNHNGKVTDSGGDAFGYGLYPGQYGMVLLSRYPIDKSRVRTFQHFLWQDMPNALLGTVKDPQGLDWYSNEAKGVLRLSSKSHWDVPVKVEGEIIHILASHPTPPVFDGPENRNGKRNHDEILLWVDYISATDSSAYIYDDKGVWGGLNDEAFVILGDLNASAEEGDAHKEAIQALISHPRVNNSFIPLSEGGEQHSANNAHGASHTAFWRMRADYVLPAKKAGEVIASGVFWPRREDVLQRLIKNRQASSDHRLVWVDIKLP